MGLNICDALPTPKPMKNESGGKKRGRDWAEEGGSGGDYGYTQSLIKKKKRGPRVFVVSGDGSSCLGWLNNAACLFRLVRPVSLFKVLTVRSRRTRWTGRRLSAGFSQFLHLTAVKEPVYITLGGKNKHWCWQTCLLSYNLTANLNSRTLFVGQSSTWWNKRKTAREYLIVSASRFAVTRTRMLEASTETFHIDHFPCPITIS